MMRFFNEIAQPNTPRIVVFPKNSYQAFFARNELEPRRAENSRVCKTGSFAIYRECAKSFHKATAAYARHNGIPYSDLVLVTHPYV
jgi:hypothetical protein